MSKKKEKVVKINNISKMIKIELREVHVKKYPTGGREKNYAGLLYINGVRISGVKRVYARNKNDAIKGIINRIIDHFP